MLVKEFYKIFLTEESTVKYLQDYGLLHCAKQCHKCGSEVKQYQRNDRGKIREVFRCKKKGCQTTQSVRNNNSFFTYVDANGRCNSGLSLSEIMEIVYFWVTKNQLVQIIKFTGRSKNTICDWMNLCRDIPVRLFNKRQPFGGPGQIVQIDECLLRGARKNNKGRFRLADLKAAVIPRQEDEEDTNRNYGRRIGGPWVVGLCCVLENGLIDARFFVVEKRDKETLH
uniref:ISXO2-like transposase domain-containing protein n=1 Tax=Schizaphis graminum TaxID=13262 RepID=A0A2S2NXU4_SCHGA